MCNEKYNGWTNYETWTVNLEMQDNENSSRYWDETAKEVLENSKEGEEIYDLQAIIKEWIEENIPIAENDYMYYGLLDGAISEINFYELAEHLINHHKELQEYEEK